MSNDGTNDAVVKQKVVEVDGKKHSDRAHFVDAIKVALLLRQTQAHSKIKVRDLAQIGLAEMNPEMAA